MGKYAQLVVGPAGSGKSTYVARMQEYIQSMRRRVAHAVNLDPAVERGERLPYRSTLDVRDVMTSKHMVNTQALGPNGALVAAMEYIVENPQWLYDALSDYDSDYLLVDCPGQIELFVHMNVLPRWVKILQGMGYNVCTIALLDSSFISLPSKFLSGMFICLSAMINLATPHINIISKCDLLEGGVESKELAPFLNPTDNDLRDMLQKEMKKNNKYFALNNGIVDMLEEHGLVRFVPLDWTDEDCIFALLQNIDFSVQFGEDEEVYPEDFEQPQCL